MKPFASLTLSCLLYLLVSSTQAQTIGFLKPEHPQDIPNFDDLGGSVSNIGDIDGDGYDDIVLGVSTHGSFRGAAYVVYGGPNTQLSDIDLERTTLNPATTGFSILGGGNSYLGSTVSSAGDINGDGYDDIAVISIHPSHVYVIYGRPRSSLCNIDVSQKALDPATTGFTISVSQSVMWSVASIGDINGDGYGDIAFGAGDQPGCQGPVYVIYGRATADLSDLDLSKAALDPAVNGFSVIQSQGSYFGTSVSSAGDVDKDGYDDLAIIGTNQGSEMAYILYGGPKSSLKNLDLSKTELDPATSGFTVSANGGDWQGTRTSGSGDINGDGYDDIILGVVLNTFGKAYVIYGRPRSQISNIDLSMTTLDPKTTGFTLTGGFVLDGFGHAVTFAGDINRDGYHDIIVGAPYKDTKQGKAYIVYGGPTASLNDLDFRSSILDPGTTGFTIVGDVPKGEFAYTLSRAGDINKDGYDDFIVGALDHGIGGAAFVVYGKPKSDQSNLDLSQTPLYPAQTGFIILGNDFGGALSIIKS